MVLLSRREDKHHLDERRAQLKGTFEARDLGELKWFLNVRILPDREKTRLWICQDDYIEKLVKKFNVEHARKAITPLSKLGSGSVQRYLGRAGAAEIHHF